MNDQSYEQHERLWNIPANEIYSTCVNWVHSGALATAGLHVSLVYTRAPYSGQSTHRTGADKEYTTTEF